MGILPLRPDRWRLVQTAGNGVLGDVPTLDRGRGGRGSWHVSQSLKHRWRIGADSVLPRSGSSFGKVLYTEKYAIEIKTDVVTPLGGHSTCVLQGIVLLLQRS